MRKLIEVSQDILIMCDNKECDFKIPNESKNPNQDTRHFINHPCPECGENLLTEQDYLMSQKMLRNIDWINKWFSWLTLFSFRKARKSTSVHVHDGIHIKDRSIRNEKP